MRQVVRDQGQEQRPVDDKHQRIQCRFGSNPGSDLNEVRNRQRGDGQQRVADTVLGIDAVLVRGHSGIVAQEHGLGPGDLETSITGGVMASPRTKVNQREEREDSEGKTERALRYTDRIAHSTEVSTANRNSM